MLVARGRLRTPGCAGLQPPGRCSDSPERPLQLPLLVPDQPYDRTVGEHRVHLELGTTHHEVDMRVGRVQALGRIAVGEKCGIRIVELIGGKDAT